jgi:hemolysin activation/secretion protein
MIQQITGDRGLAGKAELRYNVNPGYRFLNSAQYYGFYDIGKIWNILPIATTGIAQQASASSTGVGVRVSFNPYIYGSAVFAQPLTRRVATNASFAPRIFVSLTFTGRTPSATDQGSLPGIDRPPVGYSGGAATNGPTARANASSGI